MNSTEIVFHLLQWHDGRKLGGPKAQARIQIDLLKKWLQADLVKLKQECSIQSTYRTGSRIHHK